MNSRDLIQAGFRYASSLCHDSTEAKDLVQEAWVRVSRKYGDAQKGLLFTSIRNLWIDKSLGISYARARNGPKSYRWYKRYVRKFPEARDVERVRELLRQYENAQ